MTIPVDIDADLLATAFNDWGVSATYKRTGTPTFTIATGVVTSTPTQIAVTVVERPVTLKHTNRQGTKVEVTDKSYLVRRSQLGADPADNDLLVIGSTTYRVIEYEKSGTGALVKVFVRLSA